MTDEEQKRAMAQYAITSETKTTFSFQGYRYERLDDAIKYARQSEGRSSLAAGNAGE